ncbi:MAG: signal recognition particle protein [Phycisphaeraceae bacterium]|nr:signal recognition particle protein [Phycisphaerales bacterium]MCB9861117.1 signal recognition particle protein [Phycisphaeraceae bacterium]
MFDRLTEGFQSAYKRLTGKGTMTERNLREAVEEVRSALIDADVNLDVVESFTRVVMNDAVGQDVTKKVNPGDEFIALVHKRLVEFLGDEGTTSGILRVSPGPTIVMMCGLQGSGKTTSCGKLAAYLKKQGRSVMLCAADLQRPAAVEQLELVAQSANEMSGPSQVHFYAEPDKCTEYGKAKGVAVGVCQRALSEARRKGIDTLILDTAGRLHIDDELMSELGQVNKVLQPHQIFLVIDAMTGQDAVTSAKAFHDRLEVDGVIVSKFDSDARGGAAMSVKSVTGASIRFIGTGEKLDAIEEFHPERIAGRILGMGDVVSLVEKAQQEVDEEEAKKLEEKMAKGQMTMDDFLKQLRTLRRMGPVKQILGMLPGVGSMLKDVHIEDDQLNQIEAIIQSMTKQERAKPEIINNSRRRRIAHGSGSKQDDVGKLVKQFQMMSKLSKEMASMSARDKVDAVKGLGADGLAGLAPGLKGAPGFAARKSTRSSAPGRFKQRKRR